LSYWPTKISILTQPLAPPGRDTAAVTGDRPLKRSASVHRIARGFARICFLAPRHRSSSEPGAFVEWSLRSGSWSFPPLVDLWRRSVGLLADLP